MTDQEAGPRSVDPARSALGIVATAHVGGLVFTESHRSLPVVVASYAAAWLIVRRGGPS